MCVAYEIECWWCWAGHVGLVVGGRQRGRRRWAQRLRRGRGGLLAALVLLPVLVLALGRSLRRGQLRGRFGHWRWCRRRGQRCGRLGRCSHRRGRRWRRAGGGVAGGATPAGVSPGRCHRRGVTGGGGAFSVSVAAAWQARRRARPAAPWPVQREEWEWRWEQAWPARAVTWPAPWALGLGWLRGAAAGDCAAARRGGARAERRGRGRGAIAGAAPLSMISWSPSPLSSSSSVRLCFCFCSALPHELLVYRARSLRMLVPPSPWQWKLAR